ncbi:aspartate carbamoyltransferase catalytic subunit [Marinicella sp. W31]|uniref:aspartate carbamoyltransferase catalytic subunit n=1 Tax=Marinicella sp. W31 TaxID=3023713 RepID=UPI00375734AD
MNNLTDIKQLSRSDILALFKKADEIKGMSNSERHTLLQHRSVFTVFFENSTRTSASFQLAAQRLGTHVVSLNMAKSSTQKGESMRDTLLTLAAMQPDGLIIRHHDDGFCNLASIWLKKHNIAIINAGDGCNQHPTQGLLDLYTLYQHKDTGPLNIAIIGDIKHSRVASSLIDGLEIMSNNDIRLFGPTELMPNPRNAVRIAESMQDALDDADVVVMLRIQKERLPHNLNIDFDNWHEHYGLNENTLRYCKPDAIVMHPGPMNRGVEIIDAVADGPQSVILEQVTNGVIIRQAVLSYCLA